MRHRAGPRAVDAPVYCALTRFGLRGPRHLLALRREFARVARDAEQREVPGLLKSAFLIEDASTGYSLSIWDSEPYLSALVPSHIDAANAVFGRLDIDEQEGPELWSTQWRLATVTNNLRWNGFDLGRRLDELERERRDAVDRLP